MISPPWDFRDKSVFAPIYTVRSQISLVYLLSIDMKTDPDDLTRHY